MKLLAIVLTVATANVLMADEAALKVDSVVVRLIEQVEVPARERGGPSHDCMSAKVRSSRSANDLAQIDDTEAQLDLNRARYELQRAREQVENTAKLNLPKVAGIGQCRTETRSRSGQSLPQGSLASERDKLQLEVDPRQTGN